MTRYIIKLTPETVDRLLDLGFKPYTERTLKFDNARVVFKTRELAGVNAMMTYKNDFLIRMNQVEELMLLQSDEIRDSYLGVPKE